jgi:secreted trypsin-like serine protease
MRRVLAPLLALLAATALIPATATASGATTRVIGGSTATTADVPWQVLVLPGGYLCGGAILDATHVVTAAHCVYDEADAQITQASAIAVHAGITNRFAGGQSPAVVGVSVNPSYNPAQQTGDVAVLTLAAPGFALDGVTVKAIGLTDVGYRPTATDDLRLSGWGSTVARDPYDETTTQYPSDVLKVATGLHLNASCASVYAPFDDGQLLCAGQANLDACQGDSGGPLAVQVGGAWKLAGVVTGGAGCAWEGYPGYYARVANPAIHDFLAQLGVGYQVADPYNLTRPALTGSAKVGGIVGCDLGQWRNAYAYSVSFLADGRLIARGAAQIQLPAALAGARLSCVVDAWGLTGTAEAQSGAVLVAGPDPAPAPAPAPAAAVVAPAPAVDATPPTARITKVRCARTLCILDVRVEDPAPSSGARSVDGKVTTAYRTTCVTRHRRHACTKTVVQKLKSTPVGPGVYRLTTPKLRKGKHTFTLVATDAHGNRQAKATTASKSTK